MLGKKIRFISDRYKGECEGQIIGIGATEGVYKVKNETLNELDRTLNMEFGGLLQMKLDEEIILQEQIIEVM